MKKRVFSSAVWLQLICISCFMSIAAMAQDITDTDKREIVFLGVNVIPMDSERILTNQVVVVRSGKIVSIGKTGNYRRDALVIDGKEKYLIPGLTEMHAHIPPVNDLEPMKEALMLFACKGITTIRGMLGHPLHLELRRMIANGEVMGPRLYTSGPSLNGNSVGSAAAAVDMVKAQKKAGYDFLKLHPGLTVEKFNAITSTARTEKIPFAGHVSYEVGIWRAIEPGYGTIDHMDGFMEGLVPGIENISEQEAGLFGMYLAGKVDTNNIAKLMTSLRKANISVVATQALAERWLFPASVDVFINAPEMIYINDQTLNNWSTQKANMMKQPGYHADEINVYVQLRRKLIADCQKYGVRLLSGSDAPQIFNVPGFSLHQELAYMVNAGLTPFQALQSSTIHAAAYFHDAANRGTLRAGMKSDMVLLNGNPLTDITQTKNIAGVMLGNKWLPQAYIEASLKKLEKR